MGSMLLVVCFCLFCCSSCTILIDEQDFVGRLVKFYIRRMPTPEPEGPDLTQH